MSEGIGYWRWLADRLAACIRSPITEMVLGILVVAFDCAALLAWFIDPTPRDILAVLFWGATSICSLLIATHGIYRAEVDC